VDAQLQVRPSPSTFYGSFVWQTRIRKLLPDGEDHWWLVPADADTSVVAAEIVAAIRDYALPEMVRQIERA
jgi:hypothetical protein